MPGEDQAKWVNRAARVMSVAHGGQVIVSLATNELAREFPRLRSVEAYPTNLPLQTTSFVGRDEDIIDVAKTLEDARVVTLTGVGGVGKARLAIQTAAEVLPHFRDGAWLCELGPLSDPAGLPDVLAGALSVQPRQGMTMADGIVDVIALARSELDRMIDGDAET